MALGFAAAGWSPLILSADCRCTTFSSATCVLEEVGACRASQGECWVEGGIVLGVRGIECPHRHFGLWGLLEYEAIVVDR